MRRSSLVRVLTFGAASAFVSLSACSIFSGSDDSNGGTSEDGGSDAHDSGKHDSGTARRDSGPDGSTPEDGGILIHDDAGHVIGPDGGPLLCDPGSTVGFSGGVYHSPASTYTGACNTTEITNFAACADGSDSTQCAQFESGGLARSCGVCLLTSQSATHWGPFVGDTAPASVLNVPGCLAIAFNEGTSSTGCGGSLQKDFNCQDYVCNATTNCAGASSDDVNTCDNAAIAGGCASYDSVAQTACTKDAGGADSICTSDGTAQFLINLGNLFCGAPP